MAFTLLLAEGNNTDLSVYTSTASISPTANVPILVTVTNRHGSNAAVPSGVVGVTGLTLATTQQSTVQHPGGDIRVSKFRGINASPGTGQVEVTFAGAQIGCMIVVEELTGAVATGADAADAFGAQASATATATASTTPSVTLGSAPTAGNVTHGACGRAGGTEAVTAGSGFTQISQTSLATPASRTQTQEDVAVQTSDWTNANARDWAMIVDEIVMAGGGGGGVVIPVLMASYRRRRM